MVIIAYILIVIGGLISLLHWAYAIESWSYKRSFSVVPLLGALPLGIGLALLPETRPYAWLALVADYGTLVLPLALPVIAYEVWSTSRFNLVHCFRTRASGRAVVIKLFRRHIAVITAEFEPPVPYNDHDVLRVGSIGLVGRWSVTETGFAISGYGSNRQLLLSRENGAYTTVELNHPTENKYNYDNLGGLVLQNAP